MKNKFYTDSELVIGFVCTVGTDLDEIIKTINYRLEMFNYKTKVIRVSKDILRKSKHNVKDVDGLGTYERIRNYMRVGNSIREEWKDKGYLAKAIANSIERKRVVDDDMTLPLERHACIINSLKTPEEVNYLRSIYGSGFYLFGVYEDEKDRSVHLEEKGVKENEIKELISIDQDEGEEYGQHTRDTFQLSDFFVNIDNDTLRTKNSIHRILDLMFGEPYTTPTFDEYAMFMAYCASLRSADLSRQIGAVICKNKEILATGVNDCPKYNGGLYWPIYDEEKHDYIDVDRGRDYKRKCDSNKKELDSIARDILSTIKAKFTEDDVARLKKTRLKDLTEYGRVVHAEMEAITMCARNNISCSGASLYCTTFPCHNCAKHIISSGIVDVTYIEPYPKSKAFDFYDEVISKDKNDTDKLRFLPFFGVGPRRYLEMFSMKHGRLNDKIRKDSNGNAVVWDRNDANLRVQMVPSSYLERENIYSLEYFNNLDESEKEKIIEK